MLVKACRTRNSYLFVSIVQINGKKTKLNYYVSNLENYIIILIKKYY